MTPDEALAALGFAPTDTPSSEELRRAYLRTLKRFNPEVDPNGFARVRAAFEVARNPTFRFPATAQPAVVVEQESPEPVQAFHLTETPPHSDHLEPYRAQLAALLYMSHGPRCEVARRALAAYPDNPQARQLLLDELETDGASNEIKRVLVDGIRLGQTEFLHQALWAYPQIVPADSIHKLLADPNAGSADLALFARALAANNLAEAAVATLERIAGKSDESGFDWLQLAVETILWLHKHSQLGFARQGLAIVRRFIEYTAPAPGQIAHETAVLISLLGEFESVPDLPVELHQGLAREGLEGNFQATIIDTRRFTKNHGKWAARKWRRSLKKEAPLISSLLTWETSGTENAKEHSSLNAWPWALIRWVIFVLIMWFLRNRCSGKTPDLPASNSALPTLFGGSALPLSTAETKRLNDTGRNSWAACRRASASSFCGSARYFFISIKTEESCKSLLQRPMQYLKDSLDRSTIADRAIAHELISFLATKCP